jgi:phage terminase large subunit-like protein
MAFKDEAHGGKIKPAGYTTEFTNEQLIELDKCANDAIYFIENYCWIRSTRGFMKFALYPYQRRLISHYCKYRKSITLIGRQSGKTESAAAFLLWWAIFKEHQGILIASYKAEAAKAIMKRLKLMYEEL